LRSPYPAASHNAGATAGTAARLVEQRGARPSVHSGAKPPRRFLIRDAKVLSAVPGIFPECRRRTSARAQPIEHLLAEVSGSQRPLCWRLLL
jgi:hypothetical protein